MATMRRHRSRHWTPVRGILAASLALHAWYAWRAQRALGSLPQPEEPTSLRPAVSIVVPARNEAARLPRLLETLAPALRPGDELIVVDDDSDDGTAGVALAGGARVVTPGEQHGEWPGKPRACQAGGEAARNPWLLFLDADVELLSPCAIDSLVSTAVLRRLDAISAFTRQDARSFAERLLIPFAYRHYLAGQGRLHTFNGQCILTRRDRWLDVGGHASVAHAVAEDVALARVYERAGRAFELVDGRELLATRMYDSFGAIAEGFGKNAGAFLRDGGAGGVHTVASTTLAGAPVMTLAHGLWHRDRFLAIAGGAALALDLVSARRFARALTGTRPPLLSGLLQPLAQCLFTGLALRGIVGPKLGISRTWKGRRLDEG